MSVPESSVVYTPELLARALTRALGDQPQARWLDPCTGDGAFLRAAAELGIERNRLRGVELAIQPSEFDSLGRVERGQDFICWGEANAQIADRIIMNPPYVSMGRLGGAPRRHAESIRLPDGARLPLNANYWCCFVLRAMECLRDGGALAVVLPASWEYAQYSYPVRRVVEEGFRDVLTIRSKRPLFPNVLEGAIILLAWGRGEKPRSVRRIEVEDETSLVSVLGRAAEGRIREGVVIRPLMARAPECVPLREYLHVRIGGVTGDVGYFLLSDQQRVQLGLPRQACRPVLSRCRHLLAPVVTKHVWENLIKSGERVWLFRPSNEHLSIPAVRAYIEQGESGKCNLDSYKIRTRNPWHRTTLPRPVHGFISGMSRRLPYLILSGVHRLAATNTLYVVTFTKKVAPKARPAVGLALLSSSVRDQMRGLARVYADGLLKFEPAELGNVLLPSIRENTSAVARSFSLATKCLLAGDEDKASAIADEWLAGHTPQQVHATA